MDSALKSQLDQIEQALEDSGVQQCIAQTILRLGTLVLNKNMDYGASVFRSPILAPHILARDAILARLSDKFERAAHLSKKPPLIKSESFEDTLDDIVGYIILLKSLA